MIFYSYPWYFTGKFDDIWYFTGTLDIQQLKVTHTRSRLFLGTDTRDKGIQKIVNIQLHGDTFFSLDSFFFMQSSIQDWFNPFPLMWFVIQYSILNPWWYYTKLDYIISRHSHFLKRFFLTYSIKYEIVKSITLVRYFCCQFCCVLFHSISLCGIFWSKQEYSCV